MWTFRSNRVANGIFLLLTLIASAVGATATDTDWVASYISAISAASNASDDKSSLYGDFGDASFTISAWVRTEKGGTIFARTNLAGPVSWGAKTFFVRNGRVCFDVGHTGCVESRVAVNDGKWHHVAVSRDNESSKIAIYVDGQPSGIGEIRTQKDNARFVIKIGEGSYQFPDPSNYTGDIDELVVFSRALSADEVRAMSEVPGKSDISNSVVRWSFDGGVGTINKTSNVRFVEGKVGQGARFGGNGCIIVPATPVQKLWYELRETYTDSAVRQKMDWESLDAIWQDWGVGDWPELARRYVKAGSAIGEQDTTQLKKADEVKDQAGVDAFRSQYYRAKRLQQIIAHSDNARTDNLGKAIESGVLSGYLDSDKAKLFRNRLVDAERAITTLAATTISSDPKAEEKLVADLSQLQKDIALGSKLFNFDKIVFVKRYTFQSNHYYTDYINGCAKYGGSLCVLSLKDGSVTGIAPSLDKGIFGRIDLSFDAKRVVFAWKGEPRMGFRIYEVGIDGTGLRQLTFPPENEDELIQKYRVGYHHGTDDMDPCYLPDGGIAFISTRCQYGILCDSPDDFTTTVLYRMDADGKHMEKLSNSSVSEGSPTVMDDGRILYTRWEYVDKGSSAVKCLWAMKADGSGSSEIYGNDINYPPTMINARQIPGKSNEFVFVGAPHFPGNRVGTIIRVDTTKDIRTREPMTYITPVDVRGEGTWWNLKNGEWQWTDRGPLYAEPYPLSSSTFLVSHNPDKFWADPTAYGLYVLDESGNCVQIYRDPDISCWQPIPVRARKKPPVLVSARKPELAAKNLAAVVVTDIYKGMVNVKPGEIRYIRINEQMPRPWAARRYWDGDCYDQQHACISKHGHLGLKVQHGVVPVEADGSAYFVVPADRNIFFQALDANFMEVQRERTFVNFKSGETRSCIGCHEHSNSSGPGSGKMPLALRRAASIPGPQPGEVSGARPLYFPKDVQPVLDKHCIRCHSGDKPSGGLVLTGEMTELFSKSYENLVDRGVLKMINEVAPKCDNIEYLPAKSLGSHASKLVKLLMNGHGNVKLSREEMIRITTWVDCNGQYYGSYYGRRNIRYKGMPDFRPDPTFATATSTELPIELRTGKPQVAPPSNGAIITGSIRHKIMVADHSGGGPKSGGTKLRIFSRTGDVEWEYPTAGNIHDIWMLPNGNVLFTAGGAVTEVNRQKEIVWQFKKDVYLTACQRLPNGNTLVGDNPSTNLLEVDKSGKIVKTVHLTTSCPSKDNQFRLARKLKNGNYLAAHEGEGVVREYDPDGKVLKEFKVPGTPYAVVRLPNGNTLVSCGAAQKVIELDPSGKTVWEVSAADLGGVSLGWMAGVQRLANGNTVMSAWFPCDQCKGTNNPQILEVTPSKKIVWSFSSPDFVGMANNVVVLDEPGDATKFGVLR